VKFHYVEQIKHKKVRRGKRLRALRGVLHVENKPLRRKQTIIAIIFVVLLVTVLILLRPDFSGNEQDVQEGEQYSDGAVRQT
jgi:hypothetical protein